MRYKATFLAGLGLGYVLGTRAGRERYEQIRRAARGFLEHPRVQQTAGNLQHRAGQFAQSAAHVAADKGRVAVGKGKKMAGRVGDRLPHRLQERLRRHPAPETSAEWTYASSVDERR